MVTAVRERILDAAEEVLRTKGLARATTREIARAAGVAEGSLYNHFENKEALFVAVLAERLPGFVPLVMGLYERAGTGSVRDNLAEVARAALVFYERSVPMSAAVFATPELLERHRASLRSRGAGPHRPAEALAAYLRLEQRLGRVSPDASPEAAAALLLGACQQRAFNLQFLADQAGEGDRFADDLVGTLLEGLSV